MISSTPNVETLYFWQRKCLFGYEMNLLLTTSYGYNSCVLQRRLELVEALCNCTPHVYMGLGNISLVKIKHSRK